MIMTVRFIDRVATKWHARPFHRKRLYVVLLNLVLLNGIVWALARFVWLRDMSDAADLWQAQVALWEDLLLFDTFVLIWREGTLALDRFLGEQVTTLKDNKAIVFTDRAEQGDRIINIGDLAAVNVWHVLDRQTYVSLGSLGAGESRDLTMSLPERHLLVAEARPNYGRMFTPTLNVRTPGGVVHGFGKRIAKGLDHQGTITTYIDVEGHKFLDELNQWEPGR